jgi:hypothetical protein
MAGGLITTRAASRRTSARRSPGSCSRARGRWPSAPAVLFALALIPGLPKLAFFAWRRCSASRRTGTGPRRAGERREGASGAPPADPLEWPARHVDPLGVEVGYALIALVDEKQGGTLLTASGRSAADRHRHRHGRAARARRRQPAARPRVYSILVKGVEVARGELYPDRLLAINPGTATVRRSRARRPASPPSACRPGGSRRAARRARRRRLHRRRSRRRRCRRTCPRSSAVPARPARPPADQGDGRSRRQTRRSSSRNWCRRCVGRRGAARAAQLLRERVPIATSPPSSRRSPTRRP